VKKKDDRDIERAVRAIRPLLRELEAAKKRAAKLGLFVEDRDLLACPRCKLEEDVSIEGMLLVTKPSDRSKDTGLRFSPVKRARKHWLCPGCGARFAAESQ